MVAPTCSACGTVLEPDARFCGVCGNRIDRGPTGIDATIPDLRQAAGTSPAAGAGLPTAPLQRPPELAVVAPPSAPPSGPPAGPPPAAPLPVAPPPSGPAPWRPPQAAAGPPPRSLSPPRSPAVGPAPAAAAAPGGRLGRTAPPSLDRLLGRTLNGRYVVERKIGEGGFGAVFRGRQVATGREVALKILHPHNVGDATVVARFRREAEACSRLTNPHTVTIYDFDETEDGVLYLAMELLRGRPLQEVERLEGPLDPRRVLLLLGQVAEALGEAHAQGIVHRDMKPENVMVESRQGEDYVKVLDFGIAKLADQAGKTAQALTAVGQTLGTLEFMSPEQLRGRPLDGRSDLYALGVMAYEMLTGLLPWREARLPIEVIKFHLETLPPPPSALRRDLNIPKEVDEVVHKMVAKDPNDRHGDADELRQHLDRALIALARRQDRGRTLLLAGVAAGLVAVLTATALAVFR